jgi:hypothetical protein
MARRWVEERGCVARLCRCTSFWDISWRQRFPEIQNLLQSL